MAEANANANTTGQDVAVLNLLNCPICHNELDGVSMTPCGHRFCTQCIMQWLEHHPTCPTCRARATADDLIEDRDYDAIVVQLKERQAAADASGSQQQPGTSGGAITLENISDILQSVLPQRDQDMRNITASLIDMKTNEITRLKAVIESQTTTIAQLNGDINRLQSQVDNELPGLRERIVTLQEKVERKRDQKRELSDKLQNVTSSDTTSRAIAMQVITQNTTFEDKLLKGAQELQRIKDELEMTKKANKQLKQEKGTLSVSVESQVAKLQDKEIHMSALRDVVNGMKLHTQMLNAELAKSGREREILQKDVERLQECGDMCQVRDQEIRHLREQALPDKDITIADLQKQIEECTCELFQVRKNTIPMSNHTEVLKDEVNKTCQNLNNYYAEIFRVKLEAIEISNSTLQKRLLDAETALRSREDVGDELTQATKSYKSLVKRNSDLQDTVTSQEKDIKRLRQDNVHFKERTHQLELRIQSLDGHSQGFVSDADWC